MPISQKLYRWVGIPLLSGALLTVILLSMASFWLVEQNRIYAGSVTRAEQVLDLLARLHTQLRTIESGQRGYIITQDDAYLTAYDATTPRSRPTIAQLEALLSDDPAGAARIAQVKSLSETKIAELAETVAAVKAGDLAGALATVKTGRGLNEMRQLEDLLDGMTASENEALDIRAHEFAATNTTARWLDGLGTAATLGLALGFWLMTSRYLSTIRAAQALLAEANANLEQRVRERTAALSRGQ